MRLPKCKWIEGSTPDQPVSEVADRALAERLNLVCHYLPLAAEQADEEVEYVHQLRVATRRSAAAMGIFQATLPCRRGRWMAKQLKKLRRAAGDARDLDVLHERLSERLDNAAEDGAADVLTCIHDARQKAQPAIERLHEKLIKRGLDRRVKGLLKRVRWRGEGDEPELRTAGRTVLPPMVDGFFEAATGELHDAQSLHQLRIRGKRLRYAIELLAGGFDESLRVELYPLVESLQDRLGKLNDHATAAGWLRQWAADYQGQSMATKLERLAAEEDAAAIAESDQFRQWWTPDKKGDRRIYW